MRIPYSNVCRAFPELDRFNDQQCRAYARSVRQSRRGAWLVMTLGRWTLAVTGFVVMTMALSALVAAMSSRADRDSELFGMLIYASIIVVSVAAPWFISISIRDLWLRRAIARHLKTTRCPACGYLLLGLRIDSGAVRCPECGDTLRLADLGLTPAMLMSQSPGAA